MKNVKCISTKNFNLTEGRVYVADETVRRNYYRVRNDNGILVNYYSKLFRVEVEEIEVPRVPVRSTVIQILESVNIESNKEENSLDLRISLTTDEVLTTFDINIGITTAKISCGITEYTNLNGVMENISENVIRRTENNLNLRKEIFRKIIYLLKTEIVNATFSLLSTNITDNIGMDPYFEVLTEEASTYLEGRNPNSGNTIGLWTLEHNQEEE